MCHALFFFFFFSSRRRHTRSKRDWSSDVCSSDLGGWVAQLDPRLLGGEWSAFELDLPELFARVPERIIYEDVITYPPVRQRSEERRVGKEWRSGWWADQ